MAFPFIFQDTPEPTDYWRWTEAGAYKLCEKVNFEVVSLVKYGGRFSCAIEFIRPVLKKFLLYAPMAYCAHHLDEYLKSKRTEGSIYFGTIFEIQKKI